MFFPPSMSVFLHDFLKGALSFDVIPEDEQGLPTPEHPAQTAAVAVISAPEGLPDVGKALFFCG